MDQLSFRRLLSVFAIWSASSNTIKCSLAQSPQNTSQGYDTLSFVDPLIGTVNGGHVFAGATLPFGELAEVVRKPVTDLRRDGESCCRWER